jgi:hypothetical protein
MAQYDITRTCGHVETVNITGTDAHGERDRRAEWEATKPCRDCLHEAHAKANAQAAQVAAESGLPDLTGSPKQIAWAQSIRLAALAEIPDYARKLLARYPDPATRDRLVAALARILTRIATAHTDARWWIDNRTYLASAAKDELTETDHKEMQAAEAESA